MISRQPFFNFEQSKRLVSEEKIIAERMRKLSVIKITKEYSRGINKNVGIITSKGKLQQHCTQPLLFILFN